MRITLLASVLTLLLVYPTLAQEVQVAVDEEGRVNVIDQTLAEEADLFQDYPGFIDARLFQIDGVDYELVIQYRSEGQTLRTREMLTSAEVNDLRRQVTMALAARSPATDFEEGRWKLLLTTTSFGAIHGALIPAAFGAEDSRAMAALPPMGAALGFGIPFYLTQNVDVSQAESTMALYGSIQGLSHGLFLSLLVADTDLTAQGTFGVMSVASISQGVAGYVLADRWQITAGAAEAMGYGSLFGHGAGIGTSILVLGESTDLDNATRFAAGSILAGSVAGSYFGHRMATSYGYTQGDSRINLLTGGLGLQTGATGLFLADVDNIRAGAAATMISTSAGLAAGWMLVRDKDFTRGQSNLIGLGTTAGGLLAGSISTLADASPRATSTLSLLGSIGGFAFTYALLADDAQAGVGGDFRLGINPFGGATPFDESSSIRPALHMSYQF